MYHLSHIITSIRRKVSTLVLVVAVFAALCATAEAQQPMAGRWHADFAKAAAEAKRLNKLLLIHFYADWCLPCKRMDRESLGHPALLKQLGRQFVGVKINIDKQKAVADRFKIRTLPGDMVLAPDGTVLTKSSGYQPTQKYFQQLTAASMQFAKTQRNAPTIAKGPNIDGKSPERRPAINARPVSRDNSIKKQPVFLKPVRVVKPPIGMDGYNPVALYHHRKWAKGQADFAALYKGIEYRFNSVVEQRQFLTTPQLFAPQLLGCDPVILQETDRALNGGTQHAAYFEGRLYLFVGEKTRLKFKQQPLQYTQTRHVLLLDDDAAQSRSRRQ